jgi:hypothetical protein
MALEMEKPRRADTSSDGARRIRTADLLGAIRAATKTPEVASYQCFCIKGATVPIPLDAKGYARICRVSATSRVKWLK